VGGCIAVSGGLEVAHDRLLTLMKKGVTVEQVARVTRAFTDAGILVHAYLMYGFPTETPEETLETLERVRAVIADMDYRPARIGRALRTAQTQLVALLIPDTTNTFYAAIANSIETAM